MKLHATIFGSSAPKGGSPEYEDARKLAALLTKREFRVKTGGYYGTMEAASKGAHEAGVKAIGVPIAGFDPKAPNVYAEVQKMRTLFDRLGLLITDSDLIVALPGGLGTLSEISTTWMMLQTGLLTPKPVVCCIGRNWRTLLESIAQNMEVTEKDMHLLELFETLAHFEERIDEVMRQVQEQRSERE